MWQPEKKTTKLTLLGGVIALTLGIHYGWLIEPIFGHIHWLHAIHGRFCYVPIVIAAAWFGLRGSLLTALVISILILPYVLGSNLQADMLADELAEIVFYFAIALLAGGLLDRELRSRQHAEDMRLQLERSQKMSLVGRIAAGMAHEIKNPLASIKGAVEILCDKSTSSKDRDEFQNIVSKEIRRINGSLTDFLEFARPSETKFEQLDLSEVVEANLKQVQAQARKREIAFSAAIEDSVMIYGDEEKIHQVLLNLLLNAIDASADGSIISVALNQDDRTGQARIAIEDNGEGISDANLEKVFEPFYTTKSSGTGLGLAIAKNIIEKHGGTIGLRKRSDRGTTAEVTLPLHRVGVTL